MRRVVPFALAVSVVAGTVILGAQSGSTIAGVLRGAQARRCTVAGIIRTATARLPGVVVLVTNADGTSLPGTSSALDGTYSLDVPGPGRYQLRAELMAFAPALREVVVGADASAGAESSGAMSKDACQATVDLTLTLASRTQGAAPIQAVALPKTTGKPASGEPQQQFQRVAPVAADAGGVRGDLQTAAAAAAGTEDPEAVIAHLSLPPGFSPETLSQSVTAFGSSGQTNEMMLFGGGRAGMMGGGREGGPGSAGFVTPNVPGAAVDDGAVASSQFGQGGLPGATLGGPPGGGRGGEAFGPGGGLGGRGGAGGMGGGRGMGPGGMGGGGRGGPGQGPLAGRLALGAQQNNRPRGQVAYTLGGSPFDAAPYSLNGQPTSKREYLQQRFSASIGGPIKVPHVLDLGTRTSFFLNYSGNRSSNLYNQYSTVPTLAARAGDFSALSSQLIDPATGQPFAGNQILLSRMDPAALALLKYIPEPNQEGTKQNYYYSTTNRTSSDDINLRLTRTFGTPQGRGGRGGALAGRGGGGRGGGPMGGGINLNVGLHYQRSNGTQSNPFSTIGGSRRGSGWDIPVNFSFPLFGVIHSVRFQFNRNVSNTANRFASVVDVSGNAGIAGISEDPFDWGVPTLSFSSISGLRDVTPGMRKDQTVTVSDSVVKTKGRHAFRSGVEFRALNVDSRTDSSANGAYVFTGLYTSGTGRVSGADFADFLLGLPQQASIQYGPGLEQFRSRSWAAYLQDDWRVRSNFTLNAGVRYEYQSPYWEENNRLVNLDVAPDFTAAAAVQAGTSGAFTGLFPATVVEPDRNNFAPRTGFAWRPKANYMVRGGYGINYSSVPYLSLVQRLASQPPFATTSTLTGTSADPLYVTTAFLTPTTSTTTNNFGVDRHYRIGYVHIWNLDFQRDFGRTMNIGVTYIGTKGSLLDIQRAPNRGPEGLRIEGVQPFIWESSGGRSLMNSLSVRVNRRLARGLSGGATYTLSKSMDDASSIGGGGAVVAQNDQDLAAEWGLSSFDQRHRFSANFTWELPFGPGRKWLSGSGAAATLFGGWILNGTFTAASGSPFTARVVGDVTDVARGVNGTLRADYTGAPIALGNPTLEKYFNTAAFTVPAAGTFGNSARNMIIGPGSGSLSAALMKTVQVPGTRGVSIRLQGNNVLNQVQFSTIDANLNSPTFGRVTGVRAMRSVQLIFRVMY